MRKLLSKIDKTPKMNKLITELFEINEEIDELNRKIITLYTRQQILLVKIKKKHGNP